MRKERAINTSILYHCMQAQYGGPSYKITSYEYKRVGSLAVAQVAVAMTTALVRAEGLCDGVTCRAVEIVQ